MLQWMGGSRRKVTTSRKSTQKRQKQYFEQRKRQIQQEQAATTENYAAGMPTCNQNNKKHRSLDILCLLNLSTVSEELNNHVKKSSPEVFPSKVMPVSADKFDEAGTSVDHQLEAVPQNRVMFPTHCPNSASVVHSVQMGNPKIVHPVENSTPTVRNDDSEHQKVSPSKQLSVLDLLGDDEADGEHGACPAYEAHAAFSIAGLGRVAAETPVNSPPWRDSYSSPLQAARQAHVPKSYSFVLDHSDRGMVAMEDIVNTPLRDSLKLPLYSKYEQESFSKAKQNKFIVEDCIQLDQSSSSIRSNHGDKFFSSYAESEDSFDAKSSYVDGNFLDEADYDKPWNLYQVDDGFSFPKFQDQVVSDFAWISPRKLKRRDFEEERDCFSMSEPHKPYPIYGQPKNNNKFTASDVARSLVAEGFGDFEDIIDHQALSRYASEDTKDNLSLLSEESCSSSAVMGEPTMESSLDPSVSESFGSHVNNLGNLKYDSETLCPKGTMYRKKYVDRNVQPVRNFGKQRTEKTTFSGHDKIPTLRPKTRKDSPWLFDELAGVDSAHNLFGETYTSSSRVDDFAIPELQVAASLSFDKFNNNILDEPFPGRLSSEKLPSRELVDHMQGPDSPSFSGIETGPLLPDSARTYKAAATTPDFSIYAGSHEDKEGLDMPIQGTDIKDGYSKLTIPPADCLNMVQDSGTGMSSTDAAAEDKEPLHASYSKGIGVTSNEACQKTSNPDETSMFSRDKFGVTRDHNEYSPNDRQDGTTAAKATHMETYKGSDWQDECDEQVMMSESYVLQLLCVQKVLKGTPVRKTLGAKYSPFFGG